MTRLLLLLLLAACASPSPQYVGKATRIGSDTLLIKTWPKYRPMTGQWPPNILPFSAMKYTAYYFISIDTVDGRAVQILTPVLRAAWDKAKLK